MSGNVKQQKQKRVVSVYLGYYQVRYFVLTEGRSVYVGYYQVRYLVLT
jgi:hypothetical protein